MRGADPFVYRGANKGRAKFLPLFTACHVYRNFLTSVKISHTLPAIYYDGDDDDEEEPYIPAPTGPSEPYIPAPTGPAEPYKPAPTGLAAVADISGSLEDYVTAGSEVSTGSQDGILVSIEVDFESMTTIGKDHDANESILHNQLRQNPEFLRDLSRKMLNDSSRAKLIEDVISNGSTTPLSQQASWDIACIINRRLQFVPLQRTSNFGRTHCCFSCGYYLQGIYFNRKEASLENGECEKCRIEEDSVPRYAPSELTMPTFQFFPLSEPSEDLPEFENASKKDLMFYNVCPNVLMRGQSKCNKCSLQKVVRESEDVARTWEDIPWLHESCPDFVAYGQCTQEKCKKGHNHLEARRQMASAARAAIHKKNLLYINVLDWSLYPIGVPDWKGWQ